MTNSKFEKDVRGILDNHETEVNTDLLWSNVQAELYPNRKKKFAWIWFATAGLIVTVLMSTYLYYLDNTGELQPSIEYVNKTDVSNVEKINRSISANSSAIQTKKNVVENKIDDLKIRKKTKTQLKNSTIKNKIDKKSSIAIETKKVQHVGLSNTSLQSKYVSIQKKDEKLKRNLPTKSNIGSDGIINNSATINSDGSPQNNKAIKIDTTSTSQAFEIATNPAEVNHADETPIIDDSKGEQKIGTIEEPDAGETPPPILSRKLKRAFQVGLGLRAGISNSLTTLETRSDEFSELRKLRSQSESNLETVDFAIEFLLKHKSGVYISTGVDYLRAARKLEFNNEVVTVDTVMGTTVVYVHPITMDSTFVEGKVERVTNTFARKEIYNKLHLLNIPISIGASVDYEQWTFGIQGGVLLNLLLKNKGKIMDSESTFYNLKNDDANWFRNNLGVSFQGAALVGYNFTDNFQLTFGPSFRSPVIISEDINPIKQSQVGLGFQVNARYWLD